MIAKTQFQKEQIVNAAFEIAVEEGLDGITVRKVADRLGSSIAPIYVNFQRVDELVQAVVQKTLEVSQTLLAEQETGNPFHDIAVASLRFAREYPQLFRDLALQPNPYLKDYDRDIGPVLLEHMKTDPALTGFTVSELAEILLKLRIFQLGLSAMIANRLLPDGLDEEQAIQLMDSVANDVIAGAWRQKNQD